MIRGDCVTLSLAQRHHCFDLDGKFAVLEDCTITRDSEEIVEQVISFGDLTDRMAELFGLRARARARTAPAQRRYETSVLTREPPEFEPNDDLTKLLDKQGVENAKVAYTETYDIAANWKLVIENQRECYHCPAKHKSYARIQLDTELHDPDKQQIVTARIDEARTILTSAKCGRIQTSMERGGAPIEPHFEKAVCQRLWTAKRLRQ